jgi:hypothetical protein
MYKKGRPLPVARENSVSGNSGEPPSALHNESSPMGLLKYVAAGELG